MKPLFTIHHGEYLVGEYISKYFSKLNVWVPSKDDGIDLLITNKENTRCVSLQVKYSKNYIDGDIVQKRKYFPKEGIINSGWWKLSKASIKNSKANYWIFVISGIERVDFLIINRIVLNKFITTNYRNNSEPLHLYFSVTKSGKCWETRGLNKIDRELIAIGKYNENKRDFTSFLNKWDPILNQIT